MEKIRALLEQLGGSKELVNNIIESLEEFHNTTKSEVQADYRTRLEKAKEACLEEVANYKRELAKKAQIFFESRVEKIESQIAKQVAIKDSAAESKLQSIAALLEGIEVKGEGNNAEIQAALKQVKELSEAVKKYEAQNKILVEKINRSQGIAEKALVRNKILAQELVESHKAPAPVITDSKKKPAALAEGKKAATPVTTRRSSDQQIAKPKTEENKPAAVTDVYSPDAIAASMEL